ncbi:MAG: cation transporter [Polaribacter sp.]|nr:cation transporter [Polaribacter sp.]
MKKVILSVAVIAAIGFTSCKTATKEAPKTTVEKEATTAVAVSTATFGVRGNCGMCKTTIEKAANSIEGVTEATWDKDKKKMDVSFDAAKTDVMAVHTAIANSGYDTDKVMGNLEAYAGLPACCQYDHAMDMNQTGDVKEKAAH